VVLLTSILDPMAGHGAFLEQSMKRYPYANIVGVEIDPLPLYTAKLITDGKITLMSADVFTWAKERVKNNPSCNFYAIVGNAAYMSCQNLLKAKQLNVHNKRHMIIEPIHFEH